MTEGQTPIFELRVLGGFRLTRSGVALDVPARKLACLLTFLACTAPAPQSREKLANLLWGAQSDTRARHNLRQAIMRLREFLGPEALTGNGETLRLTPGLFTCDAVQFDALFAQNTAASIASAADLYGGALLEGVSVRDEAWNEWLLRERARLREQAVGAFVAQGEARLAAGAAEPAIGCGRRAVAVDSFREDAHRLLLKALAAAGRNSEALRHYRDLVRLLRSELGAEPDAETRRLADALGRETPARPAASDPTSRPVPTGEARREHAEASTRPDQRSAPPSAPTGRQEEFDLLLRRWAQARQREGRVVLVSGEPGIGKSHLAGHLAAALDADEPARLRYFSSPHHAIQPLYPYLSQLERSARTSAPGDATAKLDRLADLIRPTSRHLVRDVALLAELLGLPSEPRYPARIESPPQKRELVMTAYLELLEGLAAQRPVVVLFEDIHWLDPTSLDLLDRTIARIANLPVLLIATFRPEYQPPWVGQPHVTLLHLSRLGHRDSEAIVGEVARDRPLPRAIVDQIIERADGVPLFVTELSKHLLEREGPHGGSRRGGVRSSAATAIPATLQAALSVRLDALGPAKDLALIGAAVGRQFSRGLITELAGAQFPDLDGALERLTASGLVSRRGPSGDATYVFTHVLGRDAAYDLILRDRRRALHGTIADVLVRRFAGQAEGSAEVVAHHLSLAGREDEAVEHWVRAARSARARWANRECGEFLELALGALEASRGGPEALRLSVDLRFEMTQALTPLGEFDRIIACLRETQRPIDELGDPQRLCLFQVNMCQALGFAGRSDEAIAFGQDAEQLARALDQPQLRVEAAIVLAMAYFAVTDYGPAARVFRQVLTLLEDMPEDERIAIAGWPEIVARAYLTRICAVWGDFEAGIQYGETAVRQAEALEQPYVVGLSTWCLADLHLTRGDLPRAMPLLERGLAVSQAWDLPFLVAGHSASLGYAYALTDRASEGLPMLERAVSVFEGMRHHLALSLFSVPLGEAYVLGGRLDQARAFARDAIRRAQDSGQRSGEAGFRRILADVSALTGRLDQAEAQYREAAALAEDLGLRPLAARCRHGLARAKAGQADAERARVELAAATAMYRDMGMGFWLEQAPGVRPVTEDAAP